MRALLVRDVMATDVLTIEPSLPVDALYESLPEGSEQRRQRLYPVLGDSQFDLLGAHERVLVEERHRERPLAPHRLVGSLGALLPTREPA